MREKLVALIRQIVIPFWAGEIADHLIENGVTIPVRCKDCAFCTLYNGVHFCIKWRTFPEVSLEDFCSYGERRNTE